MGIMIREYLGNDNLTSIKGASGLAVNEYANSSLLTISENSIMVDIEAIHEYPFHTRNYTRYMKEALVGSIPSWTKPYLKPLIMHHNDKDGKIIGRIHNVIYEDKNTFSGTGALTFTVNVPDSDGKKQVEDGRLMTTSIGVLAHDVRCSICQHNIAEHGECEHERGRAYDQQVCFWDIYEMEGKELSYVIVPSDMYSKNKKIYKPNPRQLKEGMEGEFELKENEKIEASESAIIDEIVPETDTKEETPKPETEEPKAEVKDQDLVSDLSAIRQELEDVKASLEDTISELAKEKGLREALEGEIMAQRARVREATETEFNDLREAAGMSRLSQEALSKRTDESISDSIIDMREEVGPTEVATVDIKESAVETKEEIKITKVESPTLEEKDLKIEKDLKENKDEAEDFSKIDLKEEVEKLFSGVIRSRSL